MPIHTAKSLFDQNIKSAEDCLALYEAIEKLRLQGVEPKWILRAAIVFIVSALDAYFHDRIKYRVGRIPLSQAPHALAKFEITIGDLQSWSKAHRKGNIVRNWITNHLATKPLQSPNAVAEALKLVGIQSFWDSIEPDKVKKGRLLKNLNALVNRRNKMAHEGDRLTSRRSGKRLRGISRRAVIACIKFAKDLINRVEQVFPI